MKEKQESFDLLIHQVIVKTSKKARTKFWKKKTNMGGRIGYIES